MLMHSEQVSRYVNKGDVSHALCPEGWVPATHPGGALYFYNAERRIFTDVYMYDPDLSAEIHAFAALLDSERTRPFPTNNYDLVLDIITKTQNETIWAYYYIDHHSKTLFWLHYYECGDDLFSEVHGVQDASHVKLRLESLYWVHWSLYPTVPDWRRFPKNAPNELLGTLLSSGIGLGTENSHVITSVARLLSSYVVCLANWRFLNFHGQRTSRQDRYKSIYKGGLRERTRLVRILSPILFFFPDVHLRELEKVWADKISVEVLWKEFTQKLVSEWTEFVLYWRIRQSTVMLAANVAFLAIPGVIVVPQNTNLQNAWINPSPAQITSSISLVFSLGSIITGLLLIRRYRTMMTKDSKSAWYYLHGMNWPVVGLEPLAIIFSLTYALLMWSAWGFFAALLMFSFQDTSRKIWIPVGTAAGIITVPIVWCVKNIWDPEGREEGLIDWPSLEPQFGNDV
ncbi:hypothetical protein BJY52DRAFT_1223044 [Lactarius psammicola]|nr:hypothetical protein BJY52DRAFT_1223044 [Lactarius psammicola]